MPTYYPLYHSHNPLPQEQMPFINCPVPMAVAEQPLAISSLLANLLEEVRQRISRTAQSFRNAAGRTGAANFLGPTGGSFINGIVGGHRISSLFQICGVYQQEYHKTFGTSIHYFQSFSGEFFVKFIPGPFLNVKNDTRLLAGIVNKSGAEILCIMILQKRGNQGR